MSMKSFTAMCMYQIGKVTSEKYPTVNITNEWKICVSEEREKKCYFHKTRYARTEGKLLPMITGACQETGNY